MHPCHLASLLAACAALAVAGPAPAAAALRMTSLGAHASIFLWLLQWAPPAVGIVVPNAATQNLPGSAAVPWGQLPQTSNTPTPRFAQASAMSGSLFVLYGGVDVAVYENLRCDLSNAANLLSNELWAFDTSGTAYWTQLFGNHTALPALMGSVLSPIGPPDKGAMVLFGGAMLEPLPGKAADTTIVFHNIGSDSPSWQVLTPSKNTPSPRAYPATALLSNSSLFCVTGGVLAAPTEIIELSDNIQALSVEEVYCFSLDSGWSVFTAAGHAPQAPVVAGANFVYPNAAVPGELVWLHAAGIAVDGFVPAAALLINTTALRTNSSASFTWLSTTVTPQQSIDNSDAEPWLKSPFFAFGSTCFSEKMGQAVTFGGLSLGDSQVATLTAIDPAAIDLQPLRTERKPVHLNWQPAYLTLESSDSPNPYVFLSSMVCLPESSGVVVNGGISVQNEVPLTRMWLATLAGTKAVTGPAGPGSQTVVWSPLSQTYTGPLVAFSSSILVPDAAGNLHLFTLCGLPKINTAYCPVSVLSMHSGVWRKRLTGSLEAAQDGTEDNAVASRFGAAVALLPGTTTHSGGIVVAGGLTQTQNTVFGVQLFAPSNDTMVYFPGNNSLIAVSVQVNSPLGNTLPPMAFSAAGFDGKRHQLFVFGSANSTITHTECVQLGVSTLFWILDTSRMVWQEVVRNVGVRWPPARGYARGAAHDGRFYLFGGHGGKGVGLRGDLWQYQQDARQWVPLTETASGDVPGKRYGFALALFESGQKLALLGGATDPFFNNRENISSSLYVYDIPARRWWLDTSANSGATAETTAARFAPELFYVYANKTGGSYLYMYGGLNAGTYAPVTDPLVMSVMLACPAGESAVNFAEKSCTPCDGTVQVQGAYSSDSVCEETSSRRNWIAAPVLVIVALGAAALGYFVIAPFVKRKRQQKLYHVFISYRVKSDKDIAVSLAQRLEEQRLELPLRNNETVHVKCFLDQKDLRLANEWEEGFITGLQRSCLFLPIMSEAALEPMKSISQSTTAKDNCLLEYELALEQKNKGIMCILPLLVGRRAADIDGCEEFDFANFGSHRFPPVQSVTMRERSRGPKCTVRETLTDIFSIQGIKMERYLEGPAGAASVNPGLCFQVYDALFQAAWGSPDTDKSAEPDDSLRLWQFWAGGNVKDGEEKASNTNDATAKTSKEKPSDESNVDILFTPSNRLTDLLIEDEPDSMA